MDPGEGQPCIMKALKPILIKYGGEIRLSGLQPTKSVMSLLWMLLKFSAER